MPSAFLPTVLWLTGYSGAGKTTISDLVKIALDEANCKCVVLDGDQIRRGLCGDLSFSDADRTENIRRVAEVARLLLNNGVVAIVALISPLRKDREMARAKFEVGTFVEVFVDTPLAVAEARDVKGLYRQARAGQLTQFTGVDSLYEPPAMPEIHIRTQQQSAIEAKLQIMRFLQKNRSHKTSLSHQLNADITSG